MISDTLLNKETKVESRSGISGQEIFGKKKINPIIKWKGELLRGCLIERFKARVRKTSFKDDDEERMSDTDNEKMKSFLRKLGKFGFDDWYKESSVKKLRSMRESRLGFVSEVNEEEIQDWKRELRKTKSLKSVTLKVYYCPNLIDEKIKKISRGFKALRNLQDIEMSFDTAEIADKNIMSLGQSLKRMIFLEEIKFSLKDCTGLIGVGLQSFGQVLKDLIHLKRMDLAFESREETEAEIYEQGMVSLGKGIGKLIDLESLKLELLYLYNITSEGYLNLGQGIGKLLNLKSLELEWRYLYELKDEGLFNLGLGLAKLNSLENLKILFDSISSHIFDFRLFQPLQLSKGLFSLQNIDFCFLHMSFTDTALYSLGRGLATLNSLQKIKLSFSLCQKLKGEGMKGLGRGLRALASLKTLDIHIDQCYEFCGAGMKCFGENLKALVSLETLNLNFSEAYAFIPTTMQDFGQNLETLTSLQNLVFFSNYSGFDDVGLQNLGQGLKSLCSLKTLSLELSGEFTAAGIQDIGESFKSLCCLQDLTLRVSESNFSDFGIKCLIEGWKNLPLAKIELLFYGKVFTERVIHELYQCLDQISSLKSVSLAIFIQNGLDEDEKEILKQAAYAYQWAKNAEIYFY